MSVRSDLLALSKFEHSRLRWCAPLQFSFSSDEFPATSTITLDEAWTVAKTDWRLRRRRGSLTL